MTIRLNCCNKIALMLKQFHRHLINIPVQYYSHHLRPWMSSLIIVNVFAGKRDSVEG